MEKKIILVVILSIAFLFLNTNTVMKVNAQSCPVQAPVATVTVDYPAETLIQASCSWTPVAGATSYLINIVEIETSVAIKANETVASTVNKVIFPITQDRTYRCDVVAINSCGNRSTVTSHQLLCAANGLISSVTPSTTIRVSPTITNGTSTVNPGITDPGSKMQTMTMISAIILLIATGGLMLKKV